MRADPMTETELCALAHELATQDNRATFEPVFIVEQRERVFGVESDYTEDFVWINEDDGEEVSEPERIRQLDGSYNTLGIAPDGFRRLGYVDRWVFVTACFTEEGCKRYLALDGHNLREPRIYVTSAHRNAEWQQLRAHLMRASEEAAELERLRALERDLRRACADVDCLVSLKQKRRADKWQKECKKRDRDLARVHADLSQVSRAVNGARDEAVAWRDAVATLSPGRQLTAAMARTAIADLFARYDAVRAARQEAERQLGDVADAMAPGDWTPGECTHAHAVRRIVEERDTLVERVAMYEHGVDERCAAFDDGQDALALLAKIRDSLPAWRTDIDSLLEKHLPALARPAFRAQKETA